MKLEGKTVAVPVGENVDEFRGVVKLNESSAFIFDLLKEETSMEAIVTALEREYDAPRSVIEADVKKCLEEFEERGLLV
jgi:hypothetical protein